MKCLLETAYSSAYQQNASVSLIFSLEDLPSCNRLLPVPSRPTQRHCFHSVVHFHSHSLSIEKSQLMELKTVNTGQWSEDTGASMNREIDVVVITAVTWPTSHVMFTFTLPCRDVTRGTVWADHVAAAFCCHTLHITYYYNSWNALAAIDCKFTSISTGLFTSS